MVDLTSFAWEERYKEENTPWDLMGPTPEFLRLASEGIFPKKGKALVPGGGRGHDAIHLAKSGLEVDLVDFAPSAIEKALVEARTNGAVLHAYRRDFFELPESGYFQNSYDLFLEYTFYCAIDPRLRPAYAEAAARLLKPGALFVGLFFPLKTDKPGPPFAVNREEIERLFAPLFKLEFEEPKASIKPRAGREILGIFRRR